MCQKYGVRRFWLVIKTAAELRVPQPIVTLSNKEQAELIQQMSQRYLDKNIKFHIFDNLHERPQVHVVPVDVPVEKLR